MHLCARLVHTLISQSFFERLHFDEFRRILAKYSKPRFVQPIGESETREVCVLRQNTIASQMQVITRAELLLMLQQKEARREGVTVVRALGDDDTIAAKQIRVMRHERPSLKLASGTSHAIIGA